jgi:hypothetical protein
MSGGGLFLDYDNDGWLDAFLVDGGPLTDPATAPRARHRLFHNKGNGTFEDVSAASRHRAPWLRDGRVRRRLRQRRLHRPARDRLAATPFIATSAARRSSTSRRPPASAPHPFRPVARSETWTATATSISSW